MSDTAFPQENPDPAKTLALLERCLADLDELEMGTAAVKLSDAIETIRAALHARSSS